MPVTFSLKLILWQVVLGCICGAGLLGLRFRSEQCGQQQNSSQIRALRHLDDCAQQDSHNKNTFCGEEQQHGSRETSSTQHSEEHMSVDATQEARSQNPLETSSVPPDEVPGHHQHHAWVQAHKHGDLPLLPTDRSPDSDSWDNSVSICACMLQENTTDVREWLMYHKCASMTPACCLAHLHCFHFYPVQRDSLPKYSA